LRWAEGVRGDGGRLPFAGHGAADGLWTCLLSLEDRIGDGDEPLVRYEARRHKQTDWLEPTK
jgi:hypothetical protein